MKKIKLFISFFLLFAIFSIFALNIEIKKDYTYNEERTEIKTNFKISNKKEASLNDLSVQTWSFIDSGFIKKDESFDTIYFKIPKKWDLETYWYKVKLKIIVWDKVYFPEVEVDWDDRVVLSDFVTFSPVALSKQINSFSYELEFTDKSLIVSSINISTLDTTSFSYRLAFDSTKTEADEIWIIKRADWGANEEYRYQDSKYWKSYYTKLSSQTWTSLTDAQKARIEKTKKINEYLKTNFAEDYESIEQIDSENGHPLVRPIEKTRYVKSIVIHHTASEDTTKPSDELLRWIYYYHSVQNWRWDIGYHYIVGQDWKIYEWKAWGDYVLGSHALRNNRSTVSISVIWNYQNNYLTEEQQASINKLTWYLVKKYWIDIDKERTYHKSCLTESKCANPLVDVKWASFVGHRDAGYTTCPWDNIYWLLSSFKEANSYLSSWNKLVLNAASMKVYEENKAKLAANVGLISTWNIVNSSNVGVDLVSTRNIEGQTASTGFDKNNIIKVKLSYPENQSTISLKYLDKIYDLEISDWKLYNNWILVSDKLQIWSKTWIVEITSWSRIPAWDTTKKYNDNKFRWIITLYIKSWKLVVVNELSINDYMKWIAEISNDALTEKAKTILVSARSYARWYISKDNRKFPWEYYDGSDDPNVFQKYLWYWMEQRNTNIVKLVESTIDEVITYNGKLIKPWYFNQSNWKTLSFYDYCLKNNPGKTDFCKSSQTTNYPYLIWVSDPSWSWKTTLWHWVWLSWDWATYFAKIWRDYKKIIKYYYTWVDILKLENNNSNTIVTIPVSSTWTNIVPSTNDVISKTGSTITSTGSIWQTQTSTWAIKAFSDVDSKNKYYTSISYFKNKWTLTGFSDWSFKPDNTITRIEALKIILSSFWYKKIDNKASIFTDIDTKTWENAYLQRAISLSLVDAKNKTFSPSRNISKIEVLKMIILTKKIDLTKYKLKNYTIKDVAKTDWYYSYIVYGLENKLFTLNSWYVYPTKAMTRWELIDIMYKLK